MEHGCLIFTSSTKSLLWVPGPKQEYSKMWLWLTNTYGRTPSGDTANEKWWAFHQGTPKRKIFGNKKSPGVKDMACLFLIVQWRNKVLGKPPGWQLWDFSGAFCLSVALETSVKIVPRKSAPANSGGNSQSCPYWTHRVLWLTIGQRGLRDISTGRGGWMQRFQSCGWEEREPWGSNIPQISPQGDGMYTWWLGFLCHRWISKMRNTALKTCVQAL